MNTNEVIETLKEKVKTDKVVNDVLHVFADRKRAARDMTISVGSLDQRMKMNGFKHEKAKYAEVLKMLGDLGIGTIEKTARGRVKALRDVNIKIQSLGKAVLNGEKRFEKAEKRNKFTDIKPFTPTPAPCAKTSDHLELKIILNGKEIGIKIPTTATMEEIGDIIHRLR